MMSDGAPFCHPPSLKLMRMGDSVPCTPAEVGKIENLCISVSIPIAMIFSKMVMALNQRSEHFSRSIMVVVDVNRSRMKQTISSRK